MAVATARSADEIITPRLLPCALLVEANHLPQTMPDIPYEIWMHVTQYLTLEEVKRLYPVNRSLFNIAMDERYKRGFVGVLSSANTHRSLTRLV